MSNRIIAVDFDGTLCSNAWPEIGTPYTSVINYVIHQKQTGAELILWTNRKGEKLEQAVQWCKDHGIVFDAINENLPRIIKAFGGDTRKVYADEYLDDKSVTPYEIERRTSKIRHCRRTVS